MQDRTIYAPMPVYQALTVLRTRGKSLIEQSKRQALPGEFRLVDGNLLGFCDRQSAIESGRATQPAGEFALVHIVFTHLLGEALTWQGNLRGEVDSSSCRVTVTPNGLISLEEQAAFQLEVVPGAAQASPRGELGAGPTGFGGC